MTAARPAPRNLHSGIASPGPTVQVWDDRRGTGGSSVKGMNSRLISDENGRILSGPFGCSKCVASFRERISPVVASLCCRLRGSRCHEAPGILATTDNTARDDGNQTEGALMTGTHSSAATAFCGMRCGQRRVPMPPRVKAPGRSSSIAPFAAFPISTTRAVLTAGG